MLGEIDNEDDNICGVRPVNPGLALTNTIGTISQSTFSGM